MVRNVKSEVPFGFHAKMRRREGAKDDAPTPYLRHPRERGDPVAVKASESRLGSRVRGNDEEDGE